MRKQVRISMDVVLYVTVEGIAGVGREKGGREKGGGEKVGKEGKKRWNEIFGKTQRNPIIHRKPMKSQSPSFPAPF